MSPRAPDYGPRNLRGIDGNSLLRMRDLAREVSATSPLQAERAKAGRAVERITRELRKRNVSPSPGLGASPPGEASPEAHPLV